MAIKYYCPKCRRRFIEWGAEKSGFKCPGETCDGESLVLIDSTTLEATEKPKLKRVKRKKVPPVAISDEFDIDEGMVEVPIEDEEFDEADGDEEEVELEEEIEETEDVLEGPEDFGPVEDIEAVDDIEVDDDIDEDMGDFGGDSSLDEEELA